jgi:uncharacterized protein involved in type VI secretion and phage assembly
MEGVFRQPLCIGKVLQHQDKDHPNQIKVQLTVLYEEGFNEIWAFMLEPYGGDQYGMSYVPEIGDQVIVAMLSGSVSVVMGCLRGSGKSPNEENKDNNIKTIRTKGGNEIRISDEKGKSSVTIKTKDGSAITISDEHKKLSLTDKNGKNKIEIDGKSDTVTIAAGKALSIKVGNKEAVKITASDVKISSAQMSLQANGELKLISNGITTVKGSMLKLNG